MKFAFKIVVENDDNLRLAIDAAMDFAVITLDTRRQVLYWSKGAEKIIGYRQTEMRGQTADVIFTPLDRQMNAPAQEAEKAAKYGRAEDERWHMRKDGSRFWGSGMMHPLRNSNNELVGFVKVMRDLTQRRQNNEIFFQSREQLRLIIESARGFAIFTATKDGLINSWNRGASEIFGWSEEEILGKNVDILFTPEDRATRQPEIEMETAAREGVSPDIRWHLHKNGSLVFINGYVHPVYDASGNLSGFVKIGRDLTSQHTSELAMRKSEENYRIKLEKEVEERTAKLKEINTNLYQANENLQQFASIASHDLQEPLRKIKMFTSVLKNKWQDCLPVEGAEVINKIIIASDRMGQLIRELLEYSKVAYSSKEFEPTNLHQVMQNVLSDLDLLLEEAGAQIVYPEQLPVIEAIPLQMHQLFYNLINNAAKFRSPDKPPLIRIEYSILSPGEAEKSEDLNAGETYLRVTVSDNGIGFDPQFREQIFQIFERLHPVEEFEGTGVGLALCKKITETHQGKISAVSAEGQGAAFTVTLPVRQFQNKNE